LRASCGNGQNEGDLVAAANDGASLRKGGKQLRLDGVARFSRVQAARFLGLSVRQIRWLQDTKQLHPIAVDHGYCFTRDDLEAWLNAQPGELAARAFQCFERGCTPQQTVIELRAMPSAIASLHAEWVKMSGAWTVAGPRGPRDRWEQAYGIGPLTPTKLLRALELIGSRADLRAQLHDATAA